MYTYKHIPANRTAILAIPQNHKEINTMNEYSLKQNIFDPSNKSPPNEFLLKLYLRMSLYASPIKEDKFISE
jgi:hypothetical protein